MHHGTKVLEVDATGWNKVGVTHITCLAIDSIAFVFQGSEVIFGREGGGGLWSLFNLLVEVFELFFGRQRYFGALVLAVGPDIEVFGVADRMRGCTLIHNVYPHHFAFETVFHLTVVFGDGADGGAARLDGFGKFGSLIHGLTSGLTSGSGGNGSRAAGHGDGAGSEH